MKFAALKYAILLTHIILFFSAVGLVLFLGAGIYSIYDYDSLIKIEEFNLELGESPGKVAVQLKICVAVLTNAIFLCIFWLVRKVLFMIKERGPFDPMIVSKLRIVLNGSILVILLNIVMSFVMGLFLGELKISINTPFMIIVFLISIVFVMIEILEHGITIREEQRLTI